MDKALHSTVRDREESRKHTIPERTAREALHPLVKNPQVRKHQVAIGDADRGQSRSLLPFPSNIVSFALPRKR